MWEVDVTHRASRLPDSEWTRLWSTPWFVPNSPAPAELSLSKPSGINQGTGTTFLPFSSVICRLLWIGTQRSLFFWKIRRVIIFSSLLALPQPRSVCVCTVARVSSSSPCVCTVVLVFANWPFVPVECCACRAEVIINWCLTVFVWLSLSDVIAAPLTNAELSLWEVSLKRGILGATVDLKIWAPFDKKHGTLFMEYGLHWVWEK